MTDSQKRPTPLFHLIMIAASAMLVWAYWPTWVSLVNTWMSDPDYNHGFLVIPISVWLLWQRREMLADVQIQPSWWGLLPLLIAGAIRWAGAEFFISQFEAWSIPLWIAGCVLLFGGWGLLKWSAGSIAFLWFMTPLPASLTNFITLPLQKVSALLSTWTLHLFAQPAVRQGTTIVLGANVLDVERACSGLRICYGTLAVAVAFSVLMRPRWHRVLILIGASVPVAVIANSVRVTGTGLLYGFFTGERAHEIAHDFAGIVMLPLSLALLWMVNFLCDKAAAAFSRSSQEGGLFLLKLGVPAAVILCGLVFWQMYQADQALNSLLITAAQHENAAQELEAEGQQEDAFGEWRKAVMYLEHYCHIRGEDWDPEDNAAAKGDSASEDYRAATIRLAEAADHIALNRALITRARRFYERAWEANPEDFDLASEILRLGLTGRQFDDVIRVADELAAVLPEEEDERREEAFQYKMLATVGDAESTSADRRSWDDVAEVLRHGITHDLDAVMCAYRLALVYRQRPVNDAEGDRVQDPAVAAEHVLTEMLIRDADDPLAWLARYQYRQQFGRAALPETSETGEPEVPSVPAELKPMLDQDADADLDHAIQLAAAMTPADAADAAAHSDDTDASADSGVSDAAASLLPVWLAAAQRAQDNKDIAGAIDFASKARQANPDHFRPYLLLARLTTDPEYTGEIDADEQLKRRMESISLLREARERDALADDYLIEVELFRQQWLSDVADEADAADEGADDLRDRLTRLRLEDALPLRLNLAIVEAEAMAANGHYDSAAQVLEDVLDDEAVAAAEDMQGAGELLSRVWLTLGDYQERGGNAEAAQESYQRSMRLEPDSLSNRAFLASEAEQRGQFHRAEEMYRELGDRLGDRPQILLGRVRTRLNAERQKPDGFRNLSEIPQMLDRAAEGGADSEEVAVLRADYYVLNGDPVAALRVLENAAEQEPTASLWRRLVNLRQLNGDTAGADAALQRFESLSASPQESALVRSDLLLRRGEHDAAASVLDQALADELPLEVRLALFERRLAVEAARGDGAGIEPLLQQYATELADEPTYHESLAEFHWNQNDLEKMAAAENRLRELLGDESDVWKKLSARRLIRMATMPEHESDRAQLLADARKLIGQIPEIAANARQIATLQGRLARVEGRLGDALKQLESAWKATSNPVPEGLEYLQALNAAGDAATAEQLMADLESYIVVIPQVYDAAMAMNWRYFSQEPRMVLAVAQRWTENPGDAGSYLRLARVQSLPAVGRVLQLAQRNPEDAIEAAFRKSLELDPSNPQVWGELLRMVAGRAGSTPVAVFELLDDMLQEPSMPELDRVFAAAQLLSERNLAPQAARYWHQAVAMTESGAPQAVRLRVALRAAYFFTRQDPAKARELLEVALELDPDQDEATRLLISILAGEDDVDAYHRASTLMERLLASGRFRTDADRRVAARLLYLRATKFPEDFQPTVDLRRADELLEKTARTQADHVLQAQVKAKLGQEREALQALSNLAGISSAEISTIAAFVQFWQDEFAAEDLMTRQKDEALQRLEQMQNAELVSLDLRLRPEGLSQTEKQALVDAFFERVIGAAPSDRRKSQLVQGVFEYLRKNGDHAEAVQLLKRQSPPGGVVSRAQLFTGATVAAFAAPETDDYVQGVTQLLPTVLADSQDMSLIRAAADFYFLKGEWNTTRELYVKCLEQNPTDIGVANNLALVEAASGDNFDQAREYLNQAQEAADGDALSSGYLRDTQAWLLLVQGRASDAYEILAPMAQSSASESTLMLHLAAAASELGKTEEARQALQTARNMGIQSEPLPPMDRALLEQLTHPETASASLPERD